MKIFNEIYQSRYYNPITWRLEYPPGFVEHMPRKVISRDELYELKQNEDFNPPQCYEYRGDTILDRVLLDKNEVGYDARYRYILK